ncbi:MAG: hypothetical protein ACRC2T_17505 [Thermoguttaceae bacterium]
MAKPGELILKENGTIGVRANGNTAVFNAKSECVVCCPCKPKVLGTFVTNSTTPVWDLREYQGDEMAPPGAYWRLRETGAGLFYGNGRVDANGKLAGLPDEFRSNYSYNGYMQLEIGCEDEEGTIKWP